VNKYKVIIAGANGYIGRELVILISRHPYLELVGIHGRQENQDLYQHQNLTVYSLNEIIQNSIQIDLVLLATPAPVSMEIVAALADTKLKIIDLSGAFRLSEEQFNEWYGIEHTAPQLIKNACYGLSPWEINQANYSLIANPGCYAACALMSLIPLLKANLIKTNSIIIDAKSGVSGSGKQSNPDLMFCEIANNYFPYKIGKHQHRPEIENALHAFSGQQAKIRLTTSLLPVVRGIAMTIYLEAVSSSSDEAILAAIKEAYLVAYKDYPLVLFQEIGKNNSFLLSLKNVVQTPQTHIGFVVQEGQITLFSCIDNLLKGAASQAIENINAIYQLPPHTGLFDFKEAS